METTGFEEAIARIVEEQKMLETIIEKSKF